MANQLLRVVHVLALIAITTGSLTTGQAIDPENHSRAGAQRGGGEDLAATLLDFFWPLLAVEPASVHGQTTAVIDEDGEKISDRVIKAIRHEARLSQEFLLQTRRHLHQHPELSYQEHQTSLYIQDVLDKMKIGYTSGWGRNKHLDAWKGPGGYGIVADIGTGREPCILLRADIDALPIQELANVEFRSQHNQTMHACGHDGHTTMLLGAARILKSIESQLPGTVRLVFQPAEEGGAGAKRMIEEGVLDISPKPQLAMAMHVWPMLPSGVIATRPGALLGAADHFVLSLQGVGGHAAMPHLTADPIVAASAIIMNAQTIVSRHTSPLESAVISFAAVQAGDAFNIIPSSVILKGTIRALSEETLLSLRDRLSSLVEQTAVLFGCTTTLKWSYDYYPPTVNDPNLLEHFSKHVGALVSVEGVTREMEPTMGAEDFSFFAQAIPSTFYLLGQGSATKPKSSYGLHHPKFALDEGILTQGVELHVNWAIRALRQLFEDGSVVSKPSKI